MALHHAQPGEVVSLTPLGKHLPEARSVAITKKPGFETLRLIMPANATIPRHAVPGNVMLHCLEGSIELSLSSSSVILNVNDWVYLEHSEPHSLKALQNSALLLTILFNPGPKLKPSQPAIESLERWEDEGGSSSAYQLGPS
tara:strand:- start:2906 stop:3331 length:426 start_codon:yes stop_codon:yes gene_type:complete